MYDPRDGRTELCAPGYGPVHGTGVCWRQPHEWGRKASAIDAVDLTSTPDEGNLLHTPAVDATLPTSEWQSVLALRRGGVTDADLYRLLRLRTAYRRHLQPAADGLEADPRAQFARWLVAEGRLHEGE